MHAFSIWIMDYNYNRIITIYYLELKNRLKKESSKKLKI